eukprot:Selendium_serpulae@DN6500_c3_g3_i1.p1
MPNSRAASSHSVDSSDSVDLEQQNSTVRLSRARAQFLSIGANIDEINARHHAIKEAEQQLPEGSRSPKSFENEREVVNEQISATWAQIKKAVKMTPPDWQSLISSQHPTPSNTSFATSTTRVSSENLADLSAASTTGVSIAATSEEEAEQRAPSTSSGTTGTAVGSRGHVNPAESLMSSQHGFGNPTPSNTSRATSTTRATIPPGVASVSSVASSSSVTEAQAARLPPQQREEQRQ